MDIKAEWSVIRKHFNQSFSSSFHVSIASIDSKEMPTVTPIGSFFLDRIDQKGIYFEKFPTKLPRNAGINRNICVLGVNSHKLFWVRSLFNGKFHSPPAIKLYGKLGERREANEKEIALLQKRMRFTKGLKGHKYLWDEMNVIREINFHNAESINLGAMTYQLKGQ